MADFFTRLAERALDLAPTAQPVVPSVFTPLAPARPVFGDLSAESPGERRAALETPDEADTRSAAPFAPAPENATGLTTPTSPSPAAAVGPRGEIAPQAHSGLPIAPLGLKPAKQPPQPVTLQADQASLPQAERLPPQATPADNARSKMSAPLRRSPGLVSTDAPIEGFARPASSSRIVEAFALPANPAVRSATGDGSTSFTVRGVSSAHPTLARERSSASPDATRPTVRVTIGRVEVHAIFPERCAPPARSAASPQTISLDEYLKQRRGGQR